MTIKDISPPPPIIPLHESVMVTWEDIQGHERPWVDLEEAEELEPILMRTVGFLMAHDHNKVVIASTLSDPVGLAGNVNSIPTGCVMSIRRLTESDQKPATI